MQPALVTVEQFDFLPEAQAMKLCLEAEGIRTFLADAEVVNTDWMMANAVGYFKLQVPAADALRAREVLNGLRAARQVSGAPNGASYAACLACGSEMYEEESECVECGWTYVDISGESGETPEEADLDDSPERASTLQSLATLKKPVLWLMLGPMLGYMFIAALIAVAGILATFARLTDRP